MIGQQDVKTDPGFAYYCRGRAVAQKPTWSEMERWPLSKQIRFHQYEVTLNELSKERKEHSEGVGLNG